MARRNDAAAAAEQVERQARIADKRIPPSSSPPLEPWEDALVEGMQDGSIPSAVSDSGTTSGIGKPGDPLEPTGKPSAKTFRMPTGTLSNATELKK